MIRHTEREDTANQWCHEALQQVCWRSDPALSSEGIKQASLIASEIARKSQSKFDVVVTSPYFRCVQTAVELCKHVGTDTSLLLDRSLGEVYGPQVLGEECQPAPGSLLREFDDVRRYCEENGIKVRTKVVGTWPQWGEHKGMARVRFVRRFLQYLQRSQRTGLSFALVTHGDGVAAMLSTMPAMQGRVIKQVGFGGYFLAKTSVATPIPVRGQIERADLLSDSDVEESSTSGSDAQTWTVSYSSVKIGAPIEEHFATRISRWAKKFGYAERTINHLLLYTSRQNEVPEGECMSVFATSDAITQDDDNASDTSSLVHFRTHSPQKFYQRCGVSPSSSPEKMYGTMPVSSLTPTKAYVKAGVSPVHTPVKQYALEPREILDSTKISL